MSENNQQQDEEPEGKGATITRTSGFIEDDIEPERGDFEIGYEGGEGYIKLPVLRNGEITKFSIPREEVEEYIERRDELYPTPSLPDGISREAKVEAPEGWEKGKAVNTGGGIYCRIWEKPTDFGHIEVIYQVPKQDGISIGLYNEDKEWIGEADTVFIGEQKHDTVLQPKAVTIMKELNEGQYEEDIRDVLEESPNHN